MHGNTRPNLGLKLKLNVTHCIGSGKDLSMKKGTSATDKVSHVS